MVPHPSIEWNQSADAYAAQMEKFRALLRLKNFGENADQKLKDKMDLFIRTCRNPEFQIAFVGTIKTGKSTLINALLGHNYASMAVTPETAALTRFRSSDRDYVKVTFYSTKEWTQLWKSISSGADKFMEEYNRLNADSVKKQWVDHESVKKFLKNEEIESELSIWSSSKHPEHYFVKEIEVGISTLPKDFPKQVVFVDTPGLSDPVGYRSDITKRYIKRANAVFVCVEAKKLNKEEVDTISSVFSISSHNKEKVYVIGTHWDKLNNPLKDWPDAKSFMMEQLTGKGFYDTREIAETHLIHSSAYQHILCRDYNDNDMDATRQLMMFALSLGLNFQDIRSCIPKMMEYANIGTISSIVNGDLVRNYAEYMLGDIAANYRSICSDLKRYAEVTRESAESIISAADADMDELQSKLQEAEDRCKTIQANKEALNAALKSISKQSQARLAKMMKSLDGIVK
ncbi:MAG: dynamin family protein [Oscillospiraceae bacterium]|nr:dynamin family protein [Oscillospiraceae bacterium]